MNFELISSAFAQAGETTRKPAPFWPVMLAIFAIFYFFIIRPQQKKQKDSQKMMNMLAKGDKVVTIGGIFGIISNIKEKKDAQTPEDIVVVKVSDTTKIELLRSSISKVITKSDEEVK